MLELDCGLEFDAGHDELFFTALPARSGVLLIEMREAGAQPYLARTADIRRAAERLLREPEAASKRLNLRNVATAVRYRVTGSKFEQTIALYDCARVKFPKRYRDLLRLRPPAVLKVNLHNAYPRCYVTRRISGDGGFYFGPFASRKSAEAFAEGFLDLFKMRRCQIKIRRDPEFPGCIYSEMKMCLAPCFGGCTAEEYSVEVGRMSGALATQGEALVQALEREREAASEALDFELAATLHKKLEKAETSFRGFPALVRRIDELDAVVLQRGASGESVNFFVVRGGVIADPFTLHFGAEANLKSAEEIIRGHLEVSEVAARDATGGEGAAALKVVGQSVQVGGEGDGGLEALRGKYGFVGMAAELPDHLSLLARWFYGKPRDGEIFFREKVWPYRRMLRACARILAPQVARGSEGAPPGGAPGAPGASESPASTPEQGNL